MRVDSSLRVGVDIGGTFTDLVFMDERGLRAWTKVSSTTEDFAQGIIQGLDSLITDTSAASEDIREVIHATTIATNAILEAKGAPTGLITTAGFRDVLEIRRLRMPRLYDLHWEPPQPLVPRMWRREVVERIDTHGNVVQELDEQSVHAAISHLVEAGVHSVAVCLINSYRNPDHEERIGALLQAAAPDVFVSLSSHVLPEIREYERTSTTAINAYIAPVMRSYLGRLQESFDERRIAAPVYMMQSGGGMMGAGKAAEQPIHVIESGPAAGVMGALSLANAMGAANVITLDMGGTTAKASVIEGGRITRTNDYEVGGGISLSARLQRGAGYALRVPAIDIAEVGAGGGSVSWIDPAGGLRVGPQSAGAEPGPVCYSQGGAEPTLTDANVALGFLNPTHFLGGELPIDAAHARSVLNERIAEPLVLSVEDTAHGIHRIAVSHMSRAVRAVTVERGRPPADFVLCAFGGSGPLHAAEMAQELGVKQVFVPPFPGLFSSLGLLCVDVSQHAVQTVLLPLDSVSAEEIDEHYSSLESRLAAEIGMDDEMRNDSVWQRFADLRYAGQSFELTVPFQESQPVLMREAFEQEHERTYGHKAPDDPVELVNLRVEVTLPREGAHRWGGATAAKVTQTGPQERRAYFGAVAGEQTVPLLARQDLDATPRPGPVIVEEYDTTILVPPNCSVRRDEWNNVVIDVGEELT
jgi:N-methylhydantoinase A